MGKSKFLEERKSIDKAVIQKRVARSFFYLLDNMELYSLYLCQMVLSCFLIKWSCSIFRAGFLCNVWSVSKLISTDHTLFDQRGSILCVCEIEASSLLELTTTVSYCYKEDHAAKIILHKSQSTNGLNIIYQHNLWWGLSFISEITLVDYVGLRLDCRGRNMSTCGCLSSQTINNSVYGPHTIPHWIKHQVILFIKRNHHDNWI